MRPIDLKECCKPPIGSAPPGRKFLSLLSRTLCPALNFTGTIPVLTFHSTGHCVDLDPQGLPQRRSQYCSPLLYLTVGDGYYEFLPRNPHDSHHRMSSVNDAPYKPCGVSNESDGGFDRSPTRGGQMPCFGLYERDHRGGARGKRNTGAYGYRREREGKSSRDGRPHPPNAPGNERGIDKGSTRPSIPSQSQPRLSTPHGTFPSVSPLLVHGYELEERKHEYKTFPSARSSNPARHHPYPLRSSHRANDPDRT